MIEEAPFRRRAHDALASLRKALIHAELETEMEVAEEKEGLAISFELPPARFLLTPNEAVRQIWIAPPLGGTIQLDWDEAHQSFLLLTTGEPLQPLMARLLNEHIGGGNIRLD